MSWCPVAHIDSVMEGEATCVVAEGEPLALYRIGEAVYATHDICTHAHAHLSEGFVNGDCVECPLHEGVFHIPTGRPISGPVRVPLRVYPVKVEGDQVFVQLSGEDAEHG
nr:non-heme iron oxygenase ferredoxin subunit [Pararobbsia silviterrae]